MVDFPKGICFYVSDYSEEFDAGVQRSQMSNGQAKQRPTRSKPLRIRKGTLLIQKGKRAAFDKFLRDIGNGTGYFLYGDPVTLRREKSRFIDTSFEFKLISHKSEIWGVSVQMESVIDA